MIFLANKVILLKQLCFKHTNHICFKCIIHRWFCHNRSNLATFIKMVLFPCTYLLSWRIWGQFGINLHEPISPSLLFSRPFFLFSLLFILFVLFVFFNNLNCLSRDGNVMGIKVFLSSLGYFYQARGFFFEI